ncbi:hypothetical protein LINPERHAP2_LOCUS18030 [Linum perenne]
MLQYYIVILTLITEFYTVISIQQPICGLKTNAGRCTKGKLSAIVPGPETCQHYLFSSIQVYRFSQGGVDGCRLFKVDVFQPKDASIPVYGYFTCNGGLEGKKCVECFREAVKFLERLCPGGAGGTVSFDGCCLRYELYRFCVARNGGIGGD